MPVKQFRAGKRVVVADGLLQRVRLFDDAFTGALDLDPATVRLLLIGVRYASASRMVSNFLNFAEGYPKTCCSHSILAQTKQQLEFLLYIHHNIKCIVLHLDSPIEENSSLASAFHCVEHSERFEHFQLDDNVCCNTRASDEIYK